MNLMLGDLLSSLVILLIGGFFIIFSLYVRWNVSAQNRQQRKFLELEQQLHTLSTQNHEILRLLREQVK